MREARTTALSFYGRLADDVTRAPARPRDFRISVEAERADAEYKSDGHFAFAHLEPSAKERVFRLRSAVYQARQFRKVRAGDAAMELSYPGEDELYVFVTAANGPQIGFAAIPFLPRIRAGAVVLGQGVSTTLDEGIGGEDVSSATLTNGAGVAVGSTLRIERSRNLLAKAGPYYPFSSGWTVGYVRCVEALGAPDSSKEVPLEGTRLRIVRVNEAVPQPQTVAELTLHQVVVPGSPGRTVVLGPDRDQETVTDERGRAVFYFPEQWSIGSVDVEVSRAGFVTGTTQLSLGEGKASTTTIVLRAN